MSNLMGSTGSRNGHELECFLSCCIIFMQGFISDEMASSNTYAVRGMDLSYLSEMTDLFVLCLLVSGINLSRIFFCDLLIDSLSSSSTKVFKFFILPVSLLYRDDFVEGVIKYPLGINELMYNN